MNYPKGDRSEHWCYSITRGLHNAFAHHPEGHRYRTDKHNTHIGSSFGNNRLLQSKSAHNRLSKGNADYGQGRREDRADNEGLLRYVIRPFDITSANKTSDHCPGTGG
jgi:hypothetical protein